MRFTHMLIALFLGFTGTVLAQHDGPTRLPQCPAPEDAHEATIEAYGQAAPFDPRFNKGDGNQNDPSSQARIEPSTTGASSEGGAQTQHRELAEGSNRHGKFTRGTTRKPRLKTRKDIVFRRPLPLRSILYYRRQRYAVASLELRMNLQWRAYLAMREHIGRIADKRGRDYELKAGNYGVELRGAQWVLL